MLQAELAHTVELLKGQGVDLAEWRDALAAKDLEIQNLQVLIPFRQTTVELPKCHSSA